MANVPASLFLSAIMLLVLTGCSPEAPQAASAEDQARAAALDKIRARLAAEEAWEKRHGDEYSTLRKRYKAGDDVGSQLDALKATEPRYGDLEEKAWMIVEANPSDDAAFTALKVILKGSFAAENRSKFDTPAFQAQQARVARILLDNHLGRVDFLDLAYLYLSDRQARIAYWEEVYRGSPHPQVRAEAAYRLAEQYFAAWGTSDLGPDAREELRRQAQHYGQIVQSEYADTPAAQRAEAVLAALNRSVSALGAVLPNMEVATVVGGRDALANYRGKVVLLDFWATWCGACRKDHPKLLTLKREMAGKPFEVVSISVDEAPALVTQYLAKQGNLPWPQWYVGPEGELLKQWEIQVYPTYLLVSGDGKLEARGTTLSLRDVMDRARKLVAQIEKHSP